MEIELKDIIAENNNRKRILAELSKAYNPLTGEGCSGDRIPFHTNNGKTLYLLKSQIKAPDFNPESPNANRFSHDFEFWTASVYRINGQPLKFNLAFQSIISRLTESPENSRFLILHSSNIGVTSVCEAYMLWRELFRLPCSDSVFCYADPRNRKRFRSFCHKNLKHNSRFSSLAPRSTRYLSNNILDYNNSLNYFTSCHAPMTVNGLNVANLLISDANKAVVANPRNLYVLQNSDRVARKYQSYNSSQLIILESNPDSPHLGGFFNNCYRKAINTPVHIESVRYRKPSWLRKGETDYISEIRHSYNPPAVSGFIPIFVPWYANEYNVRPLQCSVRKFWQSLTPKEYYLWEFYMCSLEQINWYRHATNYLSLNASPPKVYPTSQYEAVSHCRDKPKYYINGKLSQKERFNAVPIPKIYYHSTDPPPEKHSSFRKYPLKLPPLKPPNPYETTRNHSPSSAINFPEFFSPGSAIFSLAPN